VCKSQERVLAKLEDKLNASVVAMLDVLITYYYYYFIFIFIITLFIVMSIHHTIIMDMVKVKYKNILHNGNFTRPYRPTSLF